MVRETNHKDRMVVDYSRTVNKFTSLDAYLMLNIEALVEDMAKYKICSSLDLKSAYYQVPLHSEDSEFAALLAGSNLCHFLRLPITF